MGKVTAGHTMLEEYIAQTQKSDMAAQHPRLSVLDLAAIACAHRLAILHLVCVVAGEKSSVELHR